MKKLPYGTAIRIHTTNGGMLEGTLTAPVEVLMPENCSDDLILLGMVVFRVENSAGRTFSYTTSVEKHRISRMEIMPTESEDVQELRHEKLITGNWEE